MEFTNLYTRMLSKFTDTEILAAIGQLKASGGSKYNVDLVRSEFQNNLKLSKGSWSPLKHIKKEVLLVASN